MPIRKGDGVFPGPKAVVETSADYRGGRQTLRLQRAALGACDRVLLVEDWVETGSQAAGARALVEECGAAFLGVAAIVDQLPPDRREPLLHVHTLLPKTALGDDSPGGVRVVPGHTPTLHLTCGLPGSGKTTLARRLAVERDA